MRWDALYTHKSPYNIYIFVYRMSGLNLKPRI